MADPFTWAGIGMAATAAGGGIAAFGQEEKGAADARMFNYRAGVSRMNATINRQNSDFALTAGEDQAARSGRATEFQISREKVAQSASGFDINSGSAKAVRDSTRDLGIIDQETIRTEAGRKALGYRNAASVNDAEAQGYVMAGSNAKRAGDISALGTLIGTAGSVSAKWATASNSFGSPSSSNAYMAPYDGNQLGQLY